MERTKRLYDRLVDSSVALVVTGLLLLGVLIAVLVSQIGFPPREALFTTGIAAFILMMVFYDWYVRQ